MFQNTKQIYNGIYNGYWSYSMDEQWDSGRWTNDVSLQPGAFASAQSSFLICWDQSRVHRVATFQSDSWSSTITFVLNPIPLKQMTYIWHWFEMLDCSAMLCKLMLQYSSRLSFVLKTFHIFQTVLLKCCSVILICDIGPRWPKDQAASKVQGPHEKTLAVHSSTFGAEDKNVTPSGSQHRLISCGSHCCRNSKAGWASVLLGWFCWGFQPHSEGLLRPCCKTILCALGHFN